MQAVLASRPVLSGFPQAIRIHVRSHRSHRPRVSMSVSCSDGKLKVAVTGASGRTGKLLVQKLVAKPDTFETRAVVRSEQGKSAVIAAGVPEGQAFAVDIANASASGLGSALSGADALVIVTSAIPKIKPLSLIKVFWAKYISKEEGVRPEFGWKDNQLPEQVDWIGQKVQIDAAKAAGVKHIVLVSSMGGTDPENGLNKLGAGNILQWKRKAEQYLVASGVDYTIIHPGGLIDDKGGERQIIIDVDDKLLKRKVRNIPREDVADICIQSLLVPEARNRAFDAICAPKEDGAPTKDLATLLTELTDAYDYSINSQLEEVVV